MSARRPLSAIRRRPVLSAALAYALNARLRIPKSWASTVILPRVMEYNLTMATERLRDVGCER